MWKRILDMASMQETPGEDKILVSKRRGATEVSYQTENYTEDTTVTGVYTSPTGETGEIALSSDRPGEYTGSFISDEPGIYSISVRRSEKGEVASVRTAIQTVQFSDEYRRDISNQNLISFVENNGRILKDGENVFTRLRGKKSNKKNITFILIVLSIFMLLMDIVIRRFDLGRILGRRISAPNQRRVLVSAGNTAKVKASGRVGTKVKTKEGASVKEKEAQEGFTEAKDVTASTDIPAESNISRKEAKKAKKKDLKKKESSTESQLDTSALLQKKKDRNL